MIKAKEVAGLSSSKVDEISIEVMLSIVLDANSIKEVGV